MYARKKIKNISYIKSYNGDNDISFQSTTIELKVDKQKAVDFNMIYRSPNQDSKESEKNSIDAILKIMNDSKKDSVISGDANLPEVCYESYNACPYPGVSTDRSISFIEALNHHRFEQHVEEPTLLKMHNKDYKEEFQHTPIHDLILANQSNLVSNVEVTSGIGPSDHACILLELNV